MKRAAAILIMLAGPALAQDLRPVDPDHGDTDPLRTNLRQIQDPLSAPSNYDRVYADDERGVFVRINGAVRAVFPRSAYVPTPYGNMPIFPAGTVFEIGRSPAYPGPVDPRGGHATAPRVDRVSSQVMRLPHAIPEESLGSIWTDESLRRARIVSLINRSASRSGD